MSRPASPPGLSEVEGLAWGGFLRAHALVARRLDADLRAEVKLSLSEFEILLHVSWAGGKLRMVRLAHDLVLTGGGVTRIVARLEKLGLLERISCPKDGRGVFASLTEKGRAKLQSAHKVHVEGVKRLFLAHASPAELKVLGKFFSRAAQGAGVAAPACALDEKPSARPGRHHASRDEEPGSPGPLRDVDAQRH